MVGSLPTLTAPEAVEVKHSINVRAMTLVFCCTLIGAAAQVFMKSGANVMGASPTLEQMITNAHLMFGYALYGMSTLFLVLALREGQLSVLYPIISLTYVWVTILSLLVFRETMNLYKVTGLIIVMAGVAVLGMDRRK